MPSVSLSGHRRAGLQLAAMEKDRESVHRVDGERQLAEPLPFAVSDTNDAMAKVIRWLAENWTELI